MKLNSHKCTCEKFEERAAIIEYDGCFERAESEQKAQDELCVKCKKKEK